MVEERNENLHNADGMNEPSEASKNSEQNQDDKQLNASVEEMAPTTSDESQKLLENKSIDEVVDEIAQHVATVSEDEKESVTTETDEHIPVLSYKDMDLSALLAEAKQLLDNYPINKIKTYLEDIKIAFDDNIHELTITFKAEHSDVEDFDLKIPEIREFKLLWKEYKSKSQAYRKAIQDKLEANLKKRQDLIETLKETIDSTEYNFDERLKKFKDIQKQWRTAGSMPRNKYNDIWQTFKHHEERFYDLLDLDRDYRDKVFQENLAQKKDIIEQAKILLVQDDIHHIFKELQAFHKKWKEETGPVAKEYREKVWQEFKEVTKQIHDKRRDFYKKLKEQFGENLEKKQVLIAQLKQLTSDIPQTHKEWQNKIKEVEKIREAFYQIGYVPKQNREEIWDEFKSTIKAFNKEKNHFYKSLKELQKQNLEKKIGLIKIAEELKDSEEWETATPKFKEIQDEWKKIGHVPRKMSEKIWQQFRTACNHYFDRYYQHLRSEKNEEFDSFNKKKDYLNQLKEQFKEIDDQVNYTIDDIQAIMAKWKELGYVPDSKRYINAKFNKFINSLYDKLNIDKRELSFLKFKNTVDQYFEEGNYRKLDAEKRFVRQKVDSILREIEQTENNMMFIKSDDKNNPFKKEAERNVAKNLEILAFWKRKQQYLDSLNY